MATLKKKFFGNLSGKFGDAVFRQVGDKNIIAQRPSGYKTPDTQEFKDRTTKFGLSIQLAKSIYRLPALKVFWEREYPGAARIFNLIVRTNYPFISSDGISSSPHLLPAENGFNVNLNSNNITANSISLEVASLTDAAEINTDIEKKIRLILVMLLADPIDKRLPAFSFLKIQSEDLNLTVTDPLIFNIVPAQNYSDRILNYTQKKAFFVLITLNDNNDLVNHSSTFYSA